MKYENLHKYTEAAVKIQTRYRAYKSTSINSPKYRTSNMNSYQSFNHGIIDESSISEFSNFSLNEDNQSFLQNDIYGSNQLLNQKQVARKLINVRQSSRFSPASANHSIKITNNLNRKLSSSNLLNQSSINNQNDKNFRFFDK